MDLSSTTNFLRTTQIYCEVYVHVPTDAIIQKSRNNSPYVDNLDRFEMVANKMSYPQM
jgi:hypothetical protein